jgi:hypothetical protein
LARERSFMSHSLLAIGLVALRMYRTGTVLSVMNGDKLTNHLMDAEYAVIASFCDDFVTSDARAAELLEDLVAVADLREQAGLAQSPVRA